MSAGPPLFVDEMTGQLRLPGRITRTLVDPQLPGTALQSWWTASTGTVTTRAWTNTSTATPPGSLLNTTAASVNATAVLKPASPMNSFPVNAFLAVGLTFEGLCFDSDAGYSVAFGFFASSGGKSGVSIRQDSAQAQAYINVGDSAGTAHKTNVQYQFFTNTGSQGPRRRNLTLLWVTHDNWCYVLEDDQVVVALDISANADLLDNCFPGVSLTSIDGAAHFYQWNQSKLFVNHN